VDHLGEMACPDRASMDETVFAGARRTQHVEDRHRPLDVSIATADHQAVAFLQTPDPARHACVDERDSLVVQQFCVRLVFGIAGVAAVDHQVTRAEYVGKGGDGFVGDRARRHHHPHDSWCG
jgi:hypothetical protein